MRFHLIDMILTYSWFMKLVHQRIWSTFPLFLMLIRLVSVYLVEIKFCNLISKVIFLTASTNYEVVNFLFTIISHYCIYSSEFFLSFFFFLHFPPLMMLSYPEIVNHLVKIKLTTSLSKLYSKIISISANLKQFPIDVIWTDVHVDEFELVWAEEHTIKLNRDDY